MKILHVGLCATPGTVNGFQKAFIDLVGKENYREVFTGDKSVNEKTIQAVNELKPDIVFFQVQAENIINHQTFAYCKDSGAYVINWTGDKRHEVPQWMIDAAPFVSCTSFSNKDDVYKMISLGYESKYLEIGYDPDIYKPEGESYNVPEIVFMGNNYGTQFPLGSDRVAMVNFLKAHYGDKFGVYGTGWGGLETGNINHSQEQEAKHYRGAKIAINFSHFNSSCYTSDRMYRILGSGVLCLSHAYKGIDSIFRVGYDLDTFDNLDQLKSLIDFYLENEDQRIKTAKHGNELARRHFTFLNQVENIIKLAQ